MENITMHNTDKNDNWSTEINVRNVSPNPIIKIFNVITAVVELIFGIRRSGTMSEDGDYIVIGTKTKYFWTFDVAQGIIRISKNRIAGIKVSTEKQLVFFKFNCIAIYAAGVTEQVQYEVKVPYAEIKEKAESWLT